MEANEQQRLVIESTESPLLVIAGPGAGKTKTLVDRVLHLIIDKNVPAENILVATFTEKAAKELVTRISNQALKLGKTVNISDMYVGTLHSIFLRFLEEYRQHTGLKRNYRVLDDFEQKYTIYQNHKQFDKIPNIGLLTNDSFGWNLADRIAGLVNKVAEENLDLDKMSQCKESALLPILAEVTKVYRAMLNADNCLDFSLIQTHMWKMLDDEYVLEDIRKRIQYMMIDEYQDTNRIQENILLKIAAPANRICVVGDDDQALYRFRGATVENILRFQDKFPAGVCKKIELTKNYRSHPDVIDFYNHWMQNTYEDRNETGSWQGRNGTERYRHEKVIENAGKQNRENTSYPGVIKVMGDGIEAWYERFYAFICRLKESGKLKDYNQLALLCRSVKNERIAGLARFLESKGVPIFSPRSDMFFERREIRLVIGAYAFLFPDLVNAYLRTNNSSERAVWRYYDECAVYFGNELRSNKENKRLQVWAVSKSRELAFLKENTNYTFADLFYEMLQFPLFSKMVNVDLNSGMQDLRPIYNLALFSRLITKFEYLNNIIVFKPESLKKDVKALFNYYLNFLYDGGIGEYEDFDMITPSGCVSFMTIHQSKGLEFPITCVASLESHPTRNFTQIDEDIQNFYYGEQSYEPLERMKYFDFWRLFYTAFSRAQNLLVLTGVDNTETRGRSEHSSPSRYFANVYHRAKNWAEIFDGDNCLADFDMVKAANVKHEYSFTSHILLYENCPVQYKFFRELEFTPVRTTAVMFGTLVHQTIEDVHKAVLEGHPERVTDDNISFWMQENYKQLAKMNGLYLRESALRVIKKHVKNYVEFAQKDWSKVRDAEVPVTLQKDDYILEGKIDLIRGENDSVEILDFKTEKKPNMNSEDGREKLRRYRRQLEIYAHIIEQRYGKKVSKMHLYYTGAEDESPFITYDFNRTSIVRTIGEVDGVVNKIENKEFKMDARKRCEKLCGGCDLKNFCNSL